MSIASAPVVSTPKDPVVLSYKALRKAVGIVAIGLPFAMVLPYLVLHHPHVMQDSISAYYYTGMRNLFVGLLCAIALFMFCNRGYDKQDVRAGMFSALCAVGVAFCPMDPTGIAVKVPCTESHWYNPLHFVFAIALFATLGYFCVYLFRTQSDHPTPQKLQRNRLYLRCGLTIYGAMAIELLIMAIEHFFSSHLPPWWNKVPHVLLVEIACLWAFGVAWLVKGETFLKDSSPDLTPTRTTDNLMPQ